MRTETTLSTYISPNITMMSSATANGRRYLPGSREPLTPEERREWLATMSGVSLGSDAFFPFGDNIERPHKSGVKYVAQAGGSIRR